MILGHGHEIIRTRVHDIRIILNSKFLGGAAHATFDKPQFLKLRYGFFVLGGVLTNLLVAWVCYWLYVVLSSPSERVQVEVSFYLALANGLTIFNLLPFKSTSMGMKVPTDGLALLQLPFTSNKEVMQRLDLHLLYEALEHVERKEYDAARKIYSDYMKAYPDSKIITLNLSLILLKTGKPEEAYTEGLKLLEVIANKSIHPFRALIYNQHAWICLLLNRIEEAERYSSLALKVAPHEIHFKGTRGSILVEMGKTTEGMNLLFHDMDFQFVNNATLSAANYLMLAYFQLGNRQESGRYFDFVRENSNHLDWDERVLFDRNCEKTRKWKESDPGGEK